MLFAVAVAVIPTLVLVVVGAAARAAGTLVRAAVHLAAVELLGGLVAWRFGTDASPWAPPVPVGAGVVVGACLVVLRHRVRPIATYLRFLGAASVVFVVQFLAFSPAAPLVTGGGGATPSGSGEAAQAARDSELPPIVVLVVDALPTVSLLDGAGHIDGDLFPHLADLADDSTWYRNHTTTSAWTFQAVPTLLSGRLPADPSPLPDATSYPDNLFTLFDTTHDITAVEQITRLCPAEVCPPAGGSAVTAMLGDAADWWRGALDTEPPDGARMLPGALQPDRADELTSWIAGHDFTPGGAPGLWFHHVVLPHDPWVVLDDMSAYASVDAEPYGLFLHAFWGEVGADVARQRHLLQTQAVDRALGQLIGELRAAGTYDDSLIVVVGDHGEAYTPNRPLRGMTPAQYEQVAWTPLIVKAPGQDVGVVDDANVWNTDVLPTIAELAGLDLSWDIDGVPAGRAGAARTPGDKRLLGSEMHEIDPAEGSSFIELDGRAGFDRVLAADPVRGEGDHAVWQRTDHGGLVGQSVDQLAVEEDGVGTLRVERLDRIERRGDDPPLLELVASCRLRPYQVVAVTVNGVVAAVAPVQQPGPGAPAGDTVVHALLLPDAFTAANDVNAYLVEGSPGGETLHLLTVLGA